MTLLTRHRHPRMQAFSRALMRETQIRPADFIYPVFIQEAEGTTPIPTLPGISRFGGKALLEHIAEASARGLQAVALLVAVVSASSSGS